MQGTNLFEYAVIRYVPRPEREEFINIGVILYCPSKKFLQMKFTIDEYRLKSFYRDVNIHQLSQTLDGFREICCGNMTNSPISKLDAASRFRWLTATKSTIIQTSKVHPGFCDDPLEKLEKLHQELVAK